ncbi:MAG: hypothetical protein RLZZ214_1421 [Verrucomicrobiota bacterium]|jgi:hypothetical protein
MKSITTTFAIAAMILLGITPELQAREHHHENRVYISGYRSCGTPVYSERYFIGYDRCGNPMWGVRSIRQRYRPVVRERYVAPCPPPRYSSGRYVESDRRYGDRWDSDRRVVIQGYFGR